MRKMSVDPGVYSRVSVVVCLLATIVLASCKKETTAVDNKDTKVKKSLIAMTASDEAITSQINSFYNDVKKVHAGVVSDKTYMPEDLTFLIEGAYNMLATTVSHDREEYLSFNIESQVAKSDDGKIDAAHAAQVFYELRDKLLAFEAGLEGNDKTLAHFDLEMEDKGSSVVFKGTGDFARGPAELLACKDSLEGPINRGYLLESGWHPVAYPLPNPNTYLKGQCDINVAAKTASNRVYNQQGAARMIIKYAMNKRLGCVQQLQCGYYALVSTYGWCAPQPIATPVSQYTVLNISGGYSANKKQVDIAESYITPTISGDPDSVFKRWLTRPMVNFYIKRMPQFFDATINSSGNPDTARIYTFNIETWQNAVSPTDSTNNPGGWPTPMFQYRRNFYEIQTAKFIKVPCNSINKISLANL